MMNRLFFIFLILFSFSVLAEYPTSATPVASPNSENSTVIPTPNMQEASSGDGTVSPSTVTENRGDEMSLEEREEYERARMQEMREYEDAPPPNEGDENYHGQVSNYQNYQYSSDPYYYDEDEGMN
jgi:hypothetical protein